MPDPERYLMDIFELAAKEGGPTELYLKQWSDRPSELVVLVDGGEDLVGAFLTVPMVRQLRDQLTKWLGENPA